MSSRSKRLPAAMRRRCKALRKERRSLNLRRRWNHQRIDDLLHTTH
jgi:hypothetical protein